jgi:RND family efflux transporter MFP subunit
MRRTLLALAGLAIISVLLVGACQRSAPVSSVPPPLVHTYEVAATSAAPLELRGTLGAAQRVRLGFKQAGVVAEVRVDEGDRVARGQVVARLTDVDARSLVRVAEAARDKAKRDAQRAERLSGEGAVPTSVRDDARSQLEATEAQLAQAHEALARTDLESPVAGTVFARIAEPGETVGSGNPVLIIDASTHLIARAGATERERDRLAVGKKASLVREDGSAMTGRVTSLATSPNAQDGLYTVEVTPDAPPRDLLPGELVRLRFPGSHPGNVVPIPLDALVHRLDRDYVFVLQSSGDATVAHLRGVAVDHVEGTRLVIREGLSGGEKIVAEGAYFLQDGQTVRTVE